MLRYFRIIRKKLIEHPSKGRTGDNVRKYLLYAIGEILLVVIGILIALQVNNWNEERKMGSEEVRILNILKTDLESAVEEGAEFLRLDSISVEPLKMFLVEPDWESRLNGDGNAASLITFSIYRVVTNVPVIQVREDLKNTGSSSSISSQEIRNKLVELDNKLELLEFRIADKVTVQQTRVDEVLFKYFNLQNLVKERVTNKPHEDEWSVDLFEVLADREATNILSLKLTLSVSVFESRRQLQQTLKELILLIEQELHIP